MYKIIVTSEYEVSYDELNKIYDLLENTPQRVFLVQDIFGDYHIYDRVYVSHIDWKESDRTMAKPEFMPDENERIR